MLTGDEMNATLGLVDIAALSPLLIVLLGALLTLLFDSFAVNATKKYSAWLCFATLGVALVAAFVAPDSQNPLLIPWVRFDSLAHLFTVFFLVIGMACTLLARAFFKNFEASRGEYYFLLLSAIFGLILIGISADFLTLFLGLETLSISLYVLCGYMKRWEYSHEAAIKYFLIGALAAAFLLYGIALIYGAVGTTRFDALLGGYQALSLASGKALFLSGIALVTLGLAFKAAIVPFHFWAPDVYDGAPTPVTAFMAVGTKVGAYAAFAIIFLLALPQFDLLWNQSIAILAYPTLIYASIVAMRQEQLRRFFAYSGIANAGYLLLPLAAGTPDALPALNFYLIVYALATLGAFAVLAVFDQRNQGVMLSDLRGLFHRSPLLAGTLAFCLLTLAGIPPTAGFFAKFYLFKVTFQAGYHLLVVVALLSTILAAYYYVRIISVMLVKSHEILPSAKRSRAALTVGVLAVATIILLSFYPGPLLDLLSR